MSPGVKKLTLTKFVVLSTGILKNVFRVFGGLSNPPEVSPGVEKLTSTKFLVLLTRIPKNSLRGSKSIFDPETPFRRAPEPSRLPEYDFWNPREKHYKFGRSEFLPRGSLSRGSRALRTLGIRFLESPLKVLQIWLKSIFRPRGSHFGGFRKPSDSRTMCMGSQLRFP